MANYERDKDDVRVFDGGEDDEAEGSHLPVVIIITILVLAAFGGVVWLAYNQGVARGRSDVPTQVASNDAGKAGVGQIKVYQQPAGADDDESVQTANANPQTGESTAKPQAAPPAPKPVAQVAQVAPAAAPSPPPAALTAVKPQPQPQAVATKPPAQLTLAHPAEPTTPPPVQARSVATPSPKPVATVAPKPVATITPKPAATVAPKPVATVAPSPVETATTAAAAGGSYLLQIGAYKSQDDAMTAWKSYVGKHAALLKGFGPDVQRADLGDKGVWYRLRVSSFADRNAATGLCERLKAENGACFLAR